MMSGQIGVNHAWTGEANLETCPDSCDVAKCINNGDTAATCATLCQCTINYYYDSDLRSCIPVEEVSYCLATIYNKITGTIDVDFTEITSDYAMNYTVYSPFESFTITDLTTELPQAFTLASFDIHDIFVITNALINGEVKESLPFQCGQYKAPTFSPTRTDETRAPSKGPSNSPTTTAMPTV